MNAKTVPIGFYFAKFAQAELDGLRDFAAKKKFIKRAPMLAQWLRGTCIAEQTRRDADTLCNIVAEAQRPTIVPAAWSGKDIGDALVVLDCLGRVVKNPVVGEFVDLLQTFFVLIAAYRLRQGSTP